MSISEGKLFLTLRLVIHEMMDAMPAKERHSRFNNEIKRLALIFSARGPPNACRPNSTNKYLQPRKVAELF